jgi:hypothetical protein
MLRPACFAACPFVWLVELVLDVVLHKRAWLPRRQIRPEFHVVGRPQQTPHGDRVLRPRLGDRQSRRLCPSLNLEEHRRAACVDSLIVFLVRSPPDATAEPILEVAVHREVVGRRFALAAPVACLYGQGDSNAGPELVIARGRQHICEGHANQPTSLQLRATIS